MDRTDTAEERKQSVGAAVPKIAIGFRRGAARRRHQTCCSHWGRSVVGSIFPICEDFIAASPPRTQPEKSFVLGGRRLPGLSAQPQPFHHRSKIPRLREPWRAAAAIPSASESAPAGPWHGAIHSEGEFCAFGALARSRSHSTTDVELRGVLAVVLCPPIALTLSNTGSETATRICGGNAGLRAADADPDRQHLVPEPVAADLAGVGGRLRSLRGDAGVDHAHQRVDGAFCLSSGSASKGRIGRCIQCPRW